ncbi:MAG TPA: hypothetical protein VGH28_13875 [Polyangiaceae bacterium]|jgi:hypothetical protein
MTLIAPSDSTVKNKRLLAKVAKYERYSESLKELIAENGPKVRAANAAMRQKLLTPGQVHVDAALSNLSVQYANEEYIGEEIMPATTVAKLSDVFFKYDRRSRFGYPDDAMGSRSSANEINESRTTDNYSCKPYALKNYIDALTVAAEDAPLNEMVDLVAATAEGIAFKREVRLASILSTTSNFASSNTVSLASGVRWDSSAGGNPIADIQAARAAIWQGMGGSKVIGYCDLGTWNVLSRHPMILDLFKYTGSSPGIATPSMLAGWFDLDDILVAKGRQDTANSGQTAAFSRIWPNCFGIARVAPPGVRNVSFGRTFRFGQVQTDQWYDPSLGTKGGYYARVSTHEDHHVIANDAGYLIATPVVQTV